MRVAVITWDGGSNRQPFEVLCRGLLDREAEVHVLSHVAHRRVYEDLGAQFDVLPIGEKTPGERLSAAGERERVLGVWLSKEIADVVVTMLTAAPFDVAIVDVSLLSAFAGCEAAATPFIAVHHSLPGAAWAGPRREQFEAFIGPVNEVRRSFGLPVLAGFGDLMARARAHIVATAAALDCPAPWELPLHYVGPLQPDGTDVDLPELPPRFVLVSFSTTWQRQVDLLQGTIDALAPLDRAVVVTTGPAVAPSELVAAPNTVVVAELPHRRILHRADAVVTHAGHGTALSALTAGVPLVCLPMGRDQHDVARRVVAVGAGLEVDPNSVSGELLAAVRRVLRDPHFADKAAKLARSIAGNGGVDEALAIINRCVQQPKTVVRERHVARVQRLLPEYVSRIDWSTARVEEERTEALRALLTAAVARSPWHRDRLEGLDIESLSADDIDGLPLMTKADLMDNFDAVITDSRLSRRLCEEHLHEQPGDHLLGEFQVVASGGSSGQRGVFVYGWDPWAICFASNVRFQVRDWSRDPALASVPRVIAVVAASSPTHISAALSKTFSSGDNARYLFPVSLPLEQIVAGLNELQPTVLMGYSSFLPHLALAAKSGRLRITPQRVIAISEPLLPEAKQVIQETWGAPVASGYAMSEGMFTGSCGHGIHLPDDLCIIEPVDADGRPVAPGELSHRILVTNLYNHTQPLIRYEVTDQVTIIDPPCPCGSNFRRIEDPQGRLDDVFDYANGLSVHPHVFRSALGQHPAVIEYQVRQTPRGAAVAVVAAARMDVRALRTKLVEALALLGLSDPDVTIEIQVELPRQASGKLKRFVPLSH